MGRNDVEVRWARDAHELRGALDVREQVFCVEQGVPVQEEVDGRDEQALHVVAVLAGDRARVVGTIRLLIEGRRAKVGRVAVEAAWRRRGIASRMLALALEGARAHGCTEARLAAQVEAVALYEQAGFTVESELFEEAGMAHVWMGRRLAPDS